MLRHNLKLVKQPKESTIQQFPKLFFNSIFIIRKRYFDKADSLISSEITYSKLEISKSFKRVAIQLILQT